VLGLLCAADGCPVAVEVFEGNTADPMTLSSQIDKIRLNFANILTQGAERSQDTPSSRSCIAVGFP
jgi:hypothetical protein